jgi:hypothetical protein
MAQPLLFNSERSKTVVRVADLPSRWGQTGGDGLRPDKYKQHCEGGSFAIHDNQ